VEELEIFTSNVVNEKNIQKVKNKFLAAREFSNISILDKAMNLAYYELLGDANMVNTEVEKYMSITAEDIKRVSNGIFTKNNSNTLYYLKK